MISLCAIFVFVYVRFVSFILHYEKYTIILIYRLYNVTLRIYNWTSKKMSYACRCNSTNTNIFTHISCRFWEMYFTREIQHVCILSHWSALSTNRPGDQTAESNANTLFSQKPISETVSDRHERFPWKMWTTNICVRNTFHTKISDRPIMWINMFCRRKTQHWTFCPANNIIKSLDTTTYYYFDNRRFNIVSKDIACRYTFVITVMIILCAVRDSVELRELRIYTRITIPIVVTYGRGRCTHERARRRGNKLRDGLLYCSF